MAKHIQPFNRFEPLSSDLNFMQDAKDVALGGSLLLPDEVKDRTIDNLLQPGILSPINATAVDIQHAHDSTTATPQFVITSAGGTSVHIGPGIAYNAQGERIEIIASDNVVYNIDAPTAVTYGVTGATPFSTGHRTVPYGTDGLTVDRYIFISYLQVVRTLVLPPDHNNQILITDGAPAVNARKPITGLDQSEGLAYAHHRINGYKIAVGKVGAGAGEVTIGVAGTTPTLNGDANAVYLGRFILAGGPPPTGVSSIVEHDATSPRKLAQFRPIENAKIPDVVSALPNDVYDVSGNPKIAYISSASAPQKVTLQEHVAALGHGTVAPNNPHGLSVTDITGGGAEPENITYQDESMADGIVDSSQGRNVIPPTLSSALQSTINNGVTKQVTFSALTSTQTIYIQGKRFTSISAATLNIVFVGGDPAGEYSVYCIDSGTAGVLDLVKTTVTPLPVGALPICTVWWTGSLIQPTALDVANPVPAPISTTRRGLDARNFGLVSTPQLATTAISSIDGLLANQGTTNLIYDGCFKYGLLGWQAASAFLTWIPIDAAAWAADYGGGVAPATANYLKAHADLPDVAYTGLITGWPTTTTVVDSASLLNIYSVAEYGLKMHWNAGSTAKTRLYTAMGHIKSNTIYTVSAMFRLLPGCKADLKCRFTDSTITTNYTDCYATFNPIRDDTWRRAVVTIKTNSTPTNITRPYFELLIRNDADTAPICEVSVTNIAVIEGEWALLGTNDQQNSVHFVWRTPDTTGGGYGAQTLYTREVYIPRLMLTELTFMCETYTSTLWWGGCARSAEIYVTGLTSGTPYPAETVLAWYYTNPQISGGNHQSVHCTATLLLPQGKYRFRCVENSPYTNNPRYVGWPYGQLFQIKGIAA